MARYKVIVPLLNVRQAPVATFDHKKVLPTVSEGMILELQEVTDTPDNSIGKWYTDGQGQYYWGGGLQLLPANNNLSPSLISYPWWIKNKLYSIPIIWKEKSDTVVTIALLDTGITSHLDFNFSKINGYNYLENNDDYIKDSNGHGTHLAGIMVSKGQKSFGVAPDVNLFVAKVCDDNGFPNISAVKMALEDIYSNKHSIENIFIINMSFELIPKNKVENDLKIEIEGLINKLYTEKNIISVCSSGSTDDSFNTFPSVMNSCISVGCLTKNLIRHSESRITDTLDIMAPGDKIISSNETNKTTAMSGTSQAAAFVSSVIGLVLQKKGKSVIDAALVKKVLLSTTISNSFPIQEYGYGIINPNEFFKHLI